MMHLRLALLSLLALACGRSAQATPQADGLLVSYGSYSFHRYYGECTPIVGGADLSNTVDQTFDQCAAICHSTSGCLAFVVVGSNGGISGQGTGTCNTKGACSAPGGTDSTTADYSISSVHLCGVAVMPPPSPPSPPPPADGVKVVYLGNGIAVHRYYGSCATASPVLGTSTSTFSLSFDGCAFFCQGLAGCLSFSLVVSAGAGTCTALPASGPPSPSGDATSDSSADGAQTLCGIMWLNTVNGVANVATDDQLGALSGGLALGDIVVGTGNQLALANFDDVGFSNVTGNHNQLNHDYGDSVVGDHNLVDYSADVLIVGAHNTLLGASTDTVIGSYDYLFNAHKDSVTGSDDTLLATDNIVVSASHQLCTEGVCVTKLSPPPESAPSPPMPSPAPPRPPAADNDGFLVQYQGYSFLRFFGACTNPTLGYSSQPSAVSSFDECAAQCHATRWCSSFVWTHESSTSCVLLHGHSYPPMPTVGTTITTEVSDDYSDGRAGDMVTDDND